MRSAAHAARSPSDELGYAARRDRASHLVVRHSGPHSAQHAAEAYRDLAALFGNRDDVALRFAFEPKARPGIVQQHLLLPVNPQQDNRGLDRHIAERPIDHALGPLAYDLDRRHCFRGHLAALAQRGDIRIASDLLHSLEAMRKAADTAIAMVSRHGGEDGLRGFDPEDAARRNCPGAAIGRNRRQSSLNATYIGRNVADKRDSNRRYRES